MRTLPVALLLFAACGPKAGPLGPQSDIPPPLPAIPIQPDDVAACAHLAFLGCPEAFPRVGTCVDAFAAARTVAQDARPDAGVVSISACIVASPDAATVRKCGDASTLTVECRIDGGL